MRLPRYCELLCLFVAACGGNAEGPTCTGAGCNDATAQHASGGDGEAANPVGTHAAAPGDSAGGATPSSGAGRAAMTVGVSGGQAGAGSLVGVPAGGSPTGSGGTFAMMASSGAASGSAAANSPTAAGGGTKAAAASCDASESAILNLTPQMLNQMLQAKDFELINVHVPFAGEIANTDAHIAYTDIVGIEAGLGGNRAAKAVLYCRSGSMSLMAAKTLVAAGYCQIYDLPGGMNGWTAAGFPLEQ